MINPNLYEIGFYLHWLKENSKMPIEKDWSKKERKSLKKLKESYRKGYNIGTLLSRPLTDGKYLAVIDCDMKSKDKAHRKEMLEKLRELMPDFEEAPIVKSGRGNGSMHVYIKTDKPTTPARYSQSPDKVKVYMPSVDPSKKELADLSEEELEKGIRLRAAWEISIMGEGQQVVLPPSIHPDSGKAYAWENELEDIDDIPTIELNHVSNVRTKKTLEDFEVTNVDLVTSRLSDAIVDLIISGDGGDDRSADLMKAALSMINANYSDNEILSVLTDKENYLGSAGYDHAQTNSRKKAAAWVYKYTLVKARLLNSAEGDFEKVSCVADLKEVKLSKVEAYEQSEELNAMTYWAFRLERNPPNKDGSQGKIKNTLKNLMLILKNECEENTFKRDLFALRDLYGTDTPWGGQTDKEITDYDVLLIKKWVGDNWRYEPSNLTIEEAIALLCGLNGYHPVKEYLESLEWDGKERLDNWLYTYLHAEGPKKYVRAIGRKTLAAMIARIYEPGCKFDHVLILEGLQGIGKSSVVRILAQPWFSDQELNIGDKDTVLAMQSNWVMELGELSSMSKADTDSLKQFVAQNKDRIRAPYGKKMQDYPRQSIFIGTTNNDEYLKDRTGNRRYWPVKASSVRLKKLEHDRDQLLAEAKVCYELGEPLYLEDEDAVEIAQREQGHREERDELENLVHRVLTANEDKTDDGFTLTDLTEWDGEGMNNIGTLSIKTKQDQVRLSNCLKSLGYERHKVVDGGGHRLKKWYKI